MPRSFGFVGAISEKAMVLHVGDEPGVEHPGCAFRATIHPDLDTVYCSHCGMNDRVSGAWLLAAINGELEHGTGGR